MLFIWFSNAERQVVIARSLPRIQSAVGVPPRSFPPHLHSGKRQFMQPRAHHGNRVVVTSEHQSPVLPQIATQGWLQSTRSRTKQGDIRGDRGEISLRLGAFFQQAVSKDLRLPLRFTSHSLRGTARGLQGLFLQLRRSTELARQRAD